MISTHRKYSSRNFFIGAMIAIIPFLILLYAVLLHEEALTAWDYQVGQFFYNLRSEEWTPVIIGITTIGDVRWQVILTTVVVIFLWITDQRSESELLLFNMVVGSSWLNHSLKQLVGRIRPTEVTHLIEQGGYSFPSGHAMGTTIFFATLIFIVWKNINNRSINIFLTVLFVLLIISIACSRVYLGVHFVSDIIAGTSVGLSFTLLFVGVYLQKHSKSRGYKGYKIHTN